VDLYNWYCVPGIIDKLALAELNADGKQDLLGLTSAGQIYYCVDLLNWQDVWGNLNQLSAADIDGNGRSDLVGVTDSGSVYYNIN